jgi:soluble lytic murein transglycosylase
MLLALGLFGEGESVVMRHFPVAQPRLAFTSSAALAEAGADHRSLYIAEVLKKRIPKRLPQPFLPKEYRQLLYPMGFSYLIRREASRRDIDPYLLAGIIREESRFQPRAFSGAAARGLTQFIFPTARRIADKFSLGAIDPEDLDRPEIAIALGAAYLAELGTRFGGSVPAMAAAYNAGESQSTLWGRYCLSDDPAEFYTKIAFPETRKYVRKVLTSQAHYSELYRPQPAPAREE